MRARDERTVAVLGAGIVGVSVALQLRRRGLRVILIDRREPGEETSYGNAGVIESGSYVPIAFPLSPLALARYALKRETALDFHWRFLPRVSPWILALARNSTPAALRRNGEAIDTLLKHAVGTHRARLEEGGRAHLLRETGWLHVYRSTRAFEAAGHERRTADERGHPYRVLGRDEARELEPHLSDAFEKAVLWPTVASVADPGAVTRNSFELFVEGGGEFRHARATGLDRTGSGWRVATDGEPLEVDDVVVALGPWSADLLRPLGLRFPFAVKRGYHRHYAAQGNATLARPVLDVDNGFVLTPMARGYRITTGIEFGDRDAPPTPVQVDKARRAAGMLFPLGEPVEDAPWLGGRPCLPDSRPIMGPAPGREGLWLCFGHAHLGFTLGPVSGEMMAQMMCGEPPLSDPGLFAADRFGRR